MSRNDHRDCYEEEVRLIDAGALKRDIMSYKTMPEIRKAICEVIDDAPTVEMPKAIGTVDKNGNIKLELIRPHGEWIRTTHDIKGEHPQTACWYKCPVCNKDNPVNIMFKYCPNCGADMRGGAE